MQRLHHRVQERARSPLGREPPPARDRERRPAGRAFDLRRVLRTRYRTDAFQQSYFVINRFEDVLNLVRKNDFAQLCEQLGQLPDLDPSIVEGHGLLAA